MKKNWVVSTILFIIVGAISLHFYQIQRATHDTRDIRKIPMELGGWQARNIQVTDREYEVLETRNLISREYRNGKGESMSLFVIYSETNRRVCHPPVVCLIGSGATVNQSGRSFLSFPEKEIPVNTLMVQSGNQKNLVLYWYMLDESFTEDYFTQQFRWVIRQAMGHRGGGALIRVVTPLHGTEEETLERVKEFIQELLPHLTEEKKVRST